MGAKPSQDKGKGFGRPQPLRQTLQRIAAKHPDFDLHFLGNEPVAKALAWLERFPGVGRKVSAATLNFSTLQRPALVIDAHVLRVLQRLGLVSLKATSAEEAYDPFMANLAAWTASDLSELHCLIKRLGQETCHAGRPDCRGCPLEAQCKTGGLHRRL